MLQKWMNAENEVEETGVLYRPHLVGQRQEEKEVQSRVLWSLIANLSANVFVSSDNLQDYSALLSIAAASL